MRHGMKNDEGFALMVVMGVIAVITVVAISGFWLAQETLNDSGRVQRENKAFQLAASGLDRELQTFRTSNMVNGVYSASGSTSDGTYQVTAQATGNPYEYVMTSAGRSGSATETVSQRFFFISLWDMNIGAGPAEVLGAGEGFNGNASVSGPLYSRGDIEWDSNATFEGGPMLVRDGALNVTGSGTIGLTRPIYLFATNGLTGNKAASNVYLADNEVHNSVPDITLPWVDDAYMQKAYDLSKTESIDNVMGSVNRTAVNAEVEFSALGDPYYPITAVKAAGAGDYYKYIGPITGPSGLGNGTTSLTIGSTSFGRWPGHGYDTASGMHDDFAFDTTTGTLYLEGTVFVDGPVTFNTGVRRYVGNGTLVANGDVQILTNNPSSKLTPADPSTYAPLNPSPDNCLGIVTPGDVTLGSSSTNGYFIGAVFCNGTFGLFGTTTWFSGSALAGTLYGDHPNCHLVQNPAISRCLPESMPGAGGGVVFAGTWTRS
jgi:Tfp pilus assembly protein PilX